MSISTIVLNTVSYTSYASVAEADDRLAVDPVRKATWEALDTDTKGLNLVAATYRLDLLSWQGEKTGGVAQENAWPRTGVSYPDGTAVSTTEVPVEVENATILLAGSIAIDATVSQQGSSGTNVKKVQAGTALVEFFRSQSGVPLQDISAYSLVIPFLEASIVSGETGIFVNGNDADSTFADSERWGRTRGFP